MSASPQLDVRELGSLLAARLKERRQELGLKLSEVATPAGVSIGYLSTIEKGTSVPSLPVLARLAHALELSLSEILRTSASARVARGTLSTALGTTPLAGEGSRLQVVRAAARPGSSGAAPIVLGDGDVFVYVVRGSLEIVVDGTAFEVADGDALHCDVPASVTWRVTGAARAVTVWTAARPIQRAATRASIDPDRVHSRRHAVVTSTP